jgi:hypothetical protein
MPSSGKSTDRKYQGLLQVVVNWLKLSIQLGNARFKVPVCIKLDDWALTPGRCGIATLLRTKMTRINAAKTVLREAKVNRNFRLSIISIVPLFAQDIPEV